MHPTRAGSRVPIHAKSSVIPWEVHKPQKWKANTSLSSIYPQYGPCCPMVRPMLQCSCSQYGQFPPALGPVTRQICSFKAQPGHRAGCSFQPPVTCQSQLS